MAKVLLTGATGRLGSALLPCLLKQKYKVIAIVRPGSAKPIPKGVEIIKHDISQSQLPKSAYEGVSFVVHLAGLVGEHGHGRLFVHNMLATKHVLLACPPSVKLAVIASSISVYGEHKGKLVPESFPLQPIGAYGKSKFASEVAARHLPNAPPIIALRLGMIYGPLFDEGYRAVFKGLSQGKMPLIGSGKNRIPLLHVDDAARAILLALKRPCRGFRAYNIVGEPATQESAFRLAAAALGAPAPKGSIPIFAARVLLPFLSSSLAQDHLSQLTMDRAYSTKRAEKELGFRAKVKLADGIKQMAGIYLSRRG